MLIIIIIKTSRAGPSGKNKVVYKLFPIPQAPAPRKSEETTTHARKQTTVACTLEPIQRSGVKQSVRKVIPHSNLSRQEIPSK